MVRIKHRYLVLQFLYPSAIPSGTKPDSSLLPPHLQFHAPTPASLTPASLISLLRINIQHHFGDYGAGLTSAGLKCVYMSNVTSTAIVRCRREHYRLLWAAATFIDSLPGARRGDEPRKCVLRVVRVSGTIRKAEEEVVRRAKRDIVRAKLATQGGKGGDAALASMLSAGAVRLGVTAQRVEDDEAGIEDHDEDEDMDDDSE